MTDRNDRSSLHDRVHRGGVEPGESSLGRTGRTAWVAAKREPPAHGDPTDPEVPTAKRRGERRRQRSLIVLSFVVFGLLSIALFLLYRTSQQVTSSRSPPGDASSLRHGRLPAASSAAKVARPPNTARPAGSATTRPSEVADHPAEGPVTDQAHTAASATPRIRSSAPAPNIIRAPAF